MGRKIVYRKVVISRRTYRGGGTTTRTIQGKRCFALMGECIEDGGSVDMMTWYADGDTKELMDMTLEWPDA